MIRVSHGVIIDSEGRFLLLRRAADRRYAPGKWCWPGGKLERGEQPEEALHRELHEELAAEVEVIERSRPYHLETLSERWEVFPFLCRLKGRFVLRGEEHLEARWVKVGQLERLDCARGVWPTLGRLGYLPENSP